MSYILVDIHNLFHRAKHVVRGDIDTQTGMAMHIIFASINKCWRDLGGTHVVVCSDARSWRKDFYPPYKAQRREAASAQSPAEQEANRAFMDAFDSFQEFLHEKTNVTFLQAPGCEADDFIARWIQLHPDDEHIIVSSDSDFYQLIAPNVKQYNGVMNQLITLDGIWDDRDRPVMDKKTGEQKTIGDPEWVLFEKCIRGDSSDNIFTAYPRAPKKGTKNKIGMMEAFEDRKGKGFNWNNFMLQTWVDHDEKEHRVRDDYQRNRQLIDLTMQPQEIIDVLDESIFQAVQVDHKKHVGINLMRFCGANNLVRVGDNADDHARYLGASYANKKVASS